MSLEDTTFSRIRFKATHNSYKANKGSFEEQFSHGCRGLEFDLSMAAAQNEWSVAHAKGYRSRNPQLRDLLKEAVAAFSWDVGPMLITLDIKKIPKSRDQNWGVLLDEYLGEELGAQSVFTPSNLDDVWPTLAELSKQIVFCISGGDIGEIGERKQQYRALEDRMCFVDFNNIGVPMTRTPPTTRILNFMWPWPRDTRVNRRRIAKVQEFREKVSSTMARAYGVNVDLWPDARVAPINVLSVDKYKHMHLETPFEAF